MGGRYCIGKNLFSVDRYYFLKKQNYLVTLHEFDMYFTKFLNPFKDLVLKGCVFVP